MQVWQLLLIIVVVVAAVLAVLYFLRLFQMQLIIFGLQLKFLPLLHLWATHYAPGRGMARCNVANFCLRRCLSRVILLTYGLIKTY